MRNDPEARRKEASPETVERPDGEAREAVEVRAGKADVCGGNVRVREHGELVKARDEEAVPDTGGSRLANDPQD